MRHHHDEKLPRYWSTHFLTVVPTVMGSDFIIGKGKIRVDMEVRQPSSCKEVRSATSIRRETNTNRDPYNREVSRKVEVFHANTTVSGTINKDLKHYEVYFCVSVISSRHFGSACGPN